jgi:hypothetical protein
MLRYNPFQPGSIVNPGMFTGRVEESQALEKMLFQTKNGNPHHFLIHGERGIGKSSLLVTHEWTAAGNIPPWEGDSYRFITVHVELDQADTYLSILRKVGAGLNRSITGRNRGADFAKSAWEFLKRWEIMGVRYSPGQQPLEPTEVLDELVFTFAATCAATESECDGVLVLLDEADKPVASARLGEFIKLFTERLTKRGCERVALGLAGISNVLQTLQESHASALRILTTIRLEPLLPEERLEVVAKGLKKAHEKNGFEVTITEDALSRVTLYSEGYPHFIQQFAYSAFDADEDNAITLDDVMKGAWGENGAFAQLGVKYFEDLYFAQIGSDEYRQVLRAMAEHLDHWVSKEQIRSAVSLKNTTLANALTALKKRRIILPMPGQQGMYRLPLKSFAAWIKGFATRPQ